MQGARAHALFLACVPVAALLSCCTFSPLCTEHIASVIRAPVQGRHKLSRIDSCPLEFPYGPAPAIALIRPDIFCPAIFFCFANTQLPVNEHNAFSHRPQRSPMFCTRFTVPRRVLVQSSLFAPSATPQGCGTPSGFSPSSGATRFALYARIHQTPGAGRRVCVHTARASAPANGLCHRSAVCSTASAESSPARTNVRPVRHVDSGAAGCGVVAGRASAGGLRAFATLGMLWAGEALRVTCRPDHSGVAEGVGSGRTSEREERERRVFLEKMAAEKTWCARLQPSAGFKMQKAECKGARGAKVQKCKSANVQTGCANVDSSSARAGWDGRHVVAAGGMEFGKVSLVISVILAWRLIWTIYLNFKTHWEISFQIRNAGN